MSDLKIRISASLDTDLSTVFKPLEDAAARARKTVRAELGAAAKDGIRVSKDVAKEQEKAARDASRAVEKAARDSSKEKQKLLQDEIRSVERAARERVRIEQAAMREVERELAKQNKEREKASRSAPGREYSSVRVGRRAVEGFERTVKGGVGIAADISRGAGVNFGIGDMVSKAVQNQATALDIANSAYKPGETKESRQTVAKGITERATQVANSTGIGVSESLAGIQKFVGLTGDLDTAMSSFQNLAVLSRATGTNLDDMLAAAANVSNDLGEVGDKFKTAEDKAKALDGVMKAIAGQGKIGAVEIRELSSQMAKLAAVAGQVEGDQGKNIAMMGAFAQMARAKGGASSATMAATSVASMMNTFKAPARVSEFKKQGIDVFNKEGMVRNPFEIMKEALLKKGMDPVGFKKMFANVQGARAVEGFATVYRQAGGGQKGMEAVEAEFQKYMKIAMAQGEVTDSFNARMQTTEAQAAVFQNKLQEMATQMTERVIPKLMELTPTLEKGFSAFTSIITAAAEHPIQALGVALAASVAKAGIEQVLANAISSAVSKSSLGSLGAGGGALAITAASVTLITDVFKKSEEGTKRAGELGGSANQVAADVLSGKTSVADAQKRLAEIEKEKATAQGADLSIANRAKSVLGYLTGGETTGDLSKKAALAANSDTIDAGQARLQAAITASKFAQNSLSKEAVEKQAKQFEFQAKGYDKDSEAAKAMLEAANVLKNALNGTLKVTIAGGNVQMSDAGRTGPTPPSPRGGQ